MIELRFDDRKYMLQRPDGIFEHENSNPKGCKCFENLPVWRVRITEIPGFADKTYDERRLAAGAQYWAWWESGKDGPVKHDRGFEFVWPSSLLVEVCFGGGTALIRYEKQGRGLLLPVTVEPLELVLPVIGQLTIEQALAGLEGLATRFGIDDYDLGAIERSVFGPLEAWVHELAHLVCLGLMSTAMLAPVRSPHKINLSHRVDGMIRGRAAVAVKPWRVRDHQELLAIGAELAFMRHLGACRPMDNFEERVVLDASAKLGEVPQARAIHIMYWLASRPASARRAEKIRLILNTWRFPR